LVTASTIVVGGEPVLEGDLDDGLHPPVVAVQPLERAVGITPADATGAEGLVEPVDDGWRLGGLDMGEFEAPAGVAAQGLSYDGSV
jgi:hypothetical protein